MTIRRYNPETDREACHRIWKEVGWIEDGEEASMDRYVDSGRALVAELNGAAECLVCTAPATMLYQKEDLPITIVSGVTTSHVARKQGFAGKMLARALAEDAADGALLSALSMFEQGFYNGLGYGTLGYDRRITFDPSTLNVKTRPRVPVRLSEKDWEAMHTARLGRKRLHGGCNVVPAVHTREEMSGSDPHFGFGYLDEAGAITHCLYLSTEEMESGPYTVEWMVYHSREEFLELMGLLRNLGDQVRGIAMWEPPGIQMQDLLNEPFKYRYLSKGSKFEARIKADAFFQMRILNLEGCLARTHLTGPSVTFNLALADPIERYLEPDIAWRGLGGEYVLTLGESSRAAQGMQEGLPTLRASVGAFTRLWLGVLPAWSLSYTDDLEGPPALLDQLDAALCLPSPVPDWVF